MRRNASVSNTIVTCFMNACTARAAASPCEEAILYSSKLARHKSASFSVTCVCALSNGAHMVTTCPQLTRNGRVSKTDRINNPRRSRRETRIHVYTRAQTRAKEVKSLSNGVFLSPSLFCRSLLRVLFFVFRSWHDLAARRFFACTSFSQRLVLIRRLSSVFAIAFFTECYTFASSAVAKSCLGIAVRAQGITMD